MPRAPWNPARVLASTYLNRDGVYGALVQKVPDHPESVKFWKHVSARFGAESYDLTYELPVGHDGGKNPERVKTRTA